MSFSSQEYSAIEGQAIIIDIEASKAAGFVYEIYIIISGNNFTSKKF